MAKYGVMQGSLPEIGKADDGAGQVGESLLLIDVLGRNFERRKRRKDKKWLSMAA